MEEFISLWLGSMLYTDLSYPTFYWGEQIRQERRVSSRFDLRIRCRWRRMSNLLSVRLRAAVRYFGPWNFERTVLDCLVWAHSFHKAPRASAIWRVRPTLPLIEPRLKRKTQTKQKEQPHKHAIWRISFITSQWSEFSHKATYEFKNAPWE